MRRYETVFILTPVLTEDQAKEAVKKFRKILTDMGCKILHEESWGARTTPALLQENRWEAFDKKSTGHYHLFEYETDSSVAIQELELAFKRDERILRFLTIKLDKLD